MSQPYFVEFTFVDKSRIKGEVLSRENKMPHTDCESVFQEFLYSNDRRHEFVLVREGSRQYDINLSNVTSITYGV